MYRNIYSIRRSFIIPYSIVVFLFIVLLLLSLFWKGYQLERVLLAVLIMPVLYVFLESLFRRVKTGDQGIMIVKLLRKKELSWQDITHIGAVILRKKVYLLLTTVKGFYILSYAYENFPTLVRDIVDHMDKEKVEDDVRKQVEHPVKNVSDIIMTWFTALILIGIIMMKLFTS
jgi:hypothetical protein